MLQAVKGEILRATASAYPYAAARAASSEL